jgi:hypothetical protein
MQIKPTTKKKKEKKNKNHVYVVHSGLYGRNKAVSISSIGDMVVACIDIKKRKK